MSQVKKSSSHRIGLLNLQLATGSADGDSVLQRSSRCFHQRLRGKLVALLARLGNGMPQPLCLPQVRLELGDLPLAQFETELERRLLLQLEQQLQVHLQANAESPRDARLRVSPPQTCTDAADALLFSVGEPEHLVTAHEATRLGAEVWCQQLSRYLRSGYATGSLQRILAAGADDWLRQELQADPIAWRGVLARHCLKPSAMLRLLQTFGHSGREAIGRLLLASESVWPPQTDSVWAASWLLGAVHCLHVAGTLPVVAPSGRLHSELGEAIWSEALSTRLSPVLSSLINASVTPVLTGWLQALCAPAGPCAGLKPCLPLAAQQQLDCLLTVAKQQEQGANLTPKVEPAAHRADADLLAGEGEMSGREPLLVSNAGLALLWPLLPGLLRQLGVLRDGRFIDAMAQRRAVTWLDGGIWQDSHPAEWRTPLTKLLCAWPLTEALQPWELPDDKTLAILEDLLNSLPAQIPGLARCSAQDIRRWFLQRPGQLLWRDGHWCLQVEPDASDILLAEVPWPLQHVLLPWLESAVELDWPTG